MEREAIALLCDRQGRVKKILRDNFHIAGNLSLGDPLIDLFRAGSHSQVGDFFNEIRVNNCALGWELPGPISPNLIGLQFSGCWDGKEYLVIGMQPGSNLIAVVEDLLGAKEGNRFGLSAYLAGHARLIELKSRAEGILEDEIERIQDELDLLQRDLVDKNILLEEIENRLRVFSKLSTDLAFAARVDRGNTIVGEWVTEAICDITGYSPDEYLDFTLWLRMIHTDDRSRMQSGLTKLLSGEEVSGEYRIIRKDGDIRWLRSTVYPEWDEDRDRVVRLYGTVDDITERILTEQALRESEQRLRLISENTGDVIWIMDLASQRFTYVSPSVQSVRGYTPEEVLAAPVEAALTPESYQYIVENLPRRLEAFYSGDGSALVSMDKVDQPHKDGSIVHTEVVTTLLIDQNRQVTQILGVTRDVTQRERAEQALRESEARYRLLVEKMSDGLATVNEKAQFTYVNDRFCEMVGYARRELIGHSAFMVLPKEHMEIIEQELAQRRRGKASTYEVTLKRKDGKATNVLLSGTPVTHADGSYGGSFGVFTDITLRKQTEEALREREELLSKVMDILPVGVWITDEKGNITYGNPAGQRIWSGARFVGPEEFGEYKGWWFETGEPIAPNEWAAARAVQKGETSIGELVEIEAFDGTHRIILNSALPIWDLDQKVSGAIIVNEDITERVQTDERIRLQSTALEFAANAIVITNRDGNITWVNPAFAKLTGYTLEEVINQNIDLLNSNQQDPEFFNQLWQKILSGQVWRGEIVNRRKDGSLYTEELTITPFRAGEGEITHFIEIKQDITERKKIEHDLRQAKEAAERAQEAEEERRQEAERRQRVAESLGDVITALNSNQTLEQVLDLIAQQARTLLATDGVAIYRLEGKTQEYLIESLTGLPSAYTPETAPSPGYSVMSEAVTARHPVLVPDIAEIYTKGSKAEDHEVNSSWDARYRALLAEPILVGNETYGVMLLYYANPHTFSDEERDLASLYANQVALAVENARLRAESVEVAAVRERSRLARDLHDAVTQTIYSATLVAEALPKVWERDPEEGLRNLHKLRQLVRGALAEMRTLLFELRPAALQTADLEELVIQLGDALTGRTRTQVDADINCEMEIPEEVKIVLYRVTQEAFNNVEKHAGAQRVIVSLDASPQHARLEIRDNGRGFDPSAVKGDRMGLRIMRERLQGIGASLDVDSKPGQGTRIVVTWTDSDKKYGGLVS